MDKVDIIILSFVSIMFLIGVLLIVVKEIKSQKMGFKPFIFFLLGILVGSVYLYFKIR